MIPQPTVTIIYVSGVAELFVVLRPADEGVPAPLFVYSTVDSDITGSSVDDVVVLSRCGNLCFFLNFYIGDAGNTPLVDAGTPLGRDHSRYPQRVPIVYIGGAASWRPCNVAYPHQGPVPHS